MGRRRPGTMVAMPALERTYHDLSRPIREFSFVVDAVEAGLRLDALLKAHYPWKSRAHFQRMVSNEEALLDGKAAKPSARVKKGMRVVVTLPVDPEAPVQETADDLVFLYEDEHLLAVDKPSGMTVHPSGRTRHGTLLNKLHARYRSADRKADVVPRLSHRIDRDTSGVVLIVKNRRVDALMTRAFTRREVRKTYLAIVRGVPSESEGLIDAPLGPDPEGGTHLHMRVHPDGQPAQSRWRIEGAFRRHTLLSLKPQTGRTHQLRVHLAWLGHSIACDHLYGDLRPIMTSEAEGWAAPPASGDHVLLDRLALHAHRLVFEHPVTGATVELESPLPPDLARAVACLAGHARAEPLERAS